MGLPKLITDCSGVQRISGKEDFMMLKEAFLKSIIHELVDKAAYQLSKAHLGCDHFVKFDLTVHVQEVEG